MLFMSPGYGADLGRSRLVFSKFFFETDLNALKIFVQFVQLNEYLGNAYNLLQRVPLAFLLFKRNIQNWTRLKGPPFIFFGAETFSIFFVFKGFPFDFIEDPPS